MRLPRTFPRTTPRSGRESDPESCCSFESLLVRTSQRRWIGKAPMQSLCHTGKNWTLFGTTFIANGNDIREKFSAFENIKDRLRLFLVYINLDLVHCFDRERLHLSCREPGW